MNINDIDLIGWTPIELRQACKDIKAQSVQLIDNNWEAQCAIRIRSKECTRGVHTERLQQTKTDILRIKSLTKTN